MELIAYHAIQPFQTVLSVLIPHTALSVIQVPVVIPVHHAHQLSINHQTFVMNALQLLQIANLVQVALIALSAKAHSH